MNNMKKSSILCGIAALTAAVNIYFPGTAFGEGLKVEKSNEIKVEHPFILSGVHTDQFQLVSNTDYIFQVEDCVPGDRIEAVIEAENTTNESLDLALIAIQSQLKDTALFDALELRVSYEGTILYEGAYHPKHTPMTDYITVDAGKKVRLDISVLFPEDAGNALQDKKMKSSWLFEAKHTGKESKHPVTDMNTADKDDTQDAVKTGVDLIESDFESRFFAILGLILIAVGAVLILRSDKKKN